MKSKKIILLTVAIVILSALVVFAANPGSEEDPIISLSYIKNVFTPEIHTYVDQKIAAASLNQNGSDVENSVGSYSIVSLNAGQTVICDASTELILRQGKAYVIANELGGLSDITGGYDVGNGENVIANHLLIVPRNDGRGISMETDGIFMIRGSYIIQ